MGNIKDDNSTVRIGQFVSYFSIFIISAMVLSFYRQLSFSSGTLEQYLALVGSVGLVSYMRMALFHYELDIFIVVKVPPEFEQLKHSRRNYFLYGASLAIIDLVVTGLYCGVVALLKGVGFSCHFAILLCVWLVISHLLVVSYSKFICRWFGRHLSSNDGQM